MTAKKRAGGHRAIELGIEAMRKVIRENALMARAK
jgi:hypothetical protein